MMSVGKNQRPVFWRSGPGRVSMSTDYNRSDSGGVKPNNEVEVTEQYEALRAQDDARGVPLRSTAASRTLGEMLYLAAAQENGYALTFAEIPEWERQAWESIATSFARTATRTFLGDLVAERFTDL